MELRHDFRLLTYHPSPVNYWRKFNRLDLACNQKIASGGSRYHCCLLAHFWNLVWNRLLPAYRLALAIIWKRRQATLSLNSMQMAAWKTNIFRMGFNG
ncbi:hypothetical protein [Pedobacter sp.]|uniref:hypothetical protein n=1 Tax=Pedobacter sp. TaxID=1411316 RepID=UPI003BAA2497